MLLRPRYGRIGTIGLGHMLIVDVLGPPIEVLGYLLLPALWLLGLLDPAQALAYLAVTFTFGVFLSIATLMLERSNCSASAVPHICCGSRRSQYWRTSAIGSSTISGGSSAGGAMRSVPDTNGAR